jgi:hypothetical protein
MKKSKFKLEKWTFLEGGKPVKTSIMVYRPRSAPKRIGIKAEAVMKQTPPKTQAEVRALERELISIRDVRIPFLLKVIEHWKTLYRKKK